MPTWLKQLHGEYLIQIMPYRRDGENKSWAYAGSISRAGRCPYKFGSGPTTGFSDASTAAAEGFFAGEELIKAGAADVTLD